MNEINNADLTKAVKEKNTEEQETDSVINSLFLLQEMMNQSFALF